MKSFPSSIESMGVNCREHTLACIILDRQTCRCKTGPRFALFISQANRLIRRFHHIGREFEHEKRGICAAVVIN